MRLRRGAGGSKIERQISATHRRILQAREELEVVRSQLASLIDDEDEARVHMLVTESTVAHRNWREAAGHAGKLAARQRVLVTLIEELQKTESDLLAQLVG